MRTPRVIGKAVISADTLRMPWRYLVPTCHKLLGARGVESLVDRP
jgi:hypothetical protein